MQCVDSNEESLKMKRRAIRNGYSPNVIKSGDEVTVTFVMYDIAAGRMTAEWP